MQKRQIQKAITLVKMVDFFVSEFQINLKIYGWEEL